MEGRVEPKFGEFRDLLSVGGAREEMSERAADASSRLALCIECGDGWWQLVWAI